MSKQALRALGLVCIGLVAACSEADGIESTEVTLLVGDPPVDVTSVEYRIECEAGDVWEGLFEVLDEGNTPIWQAVVGLPAGECTITLIAADPDGKSVCVGEKKVTVVADDSVKVEIDLTCRSGGPATGDIEIDADFVDENLCPIIHIVNAIPSTITDELDPTAIVQVRASDPDDGPEALATTLSSTSGTIDEPGASDSDFSCSVPGEVTISASASDGLCEVTETTTVVCPSTENCAGVDCEDGNECTAGVCNEVSGQCEFSPVDNGTACALGELPGECQGGVCMDAMLCQGKNCDDGNECTEDFCDPLNGACVNTPLSGTECVFEEGVAGLCEGGVCLNAELCDGKVCDDENECTDDSCDALTGQCESEPVDNGTVCDADGVLGQCMDGLCEDAMVCVGVDCDDQNSCTEDFCNTQTGGCENPATNEGDPCDLGDAPGRCQAGQCVDAMLCDNVTCDPVVCQDVSCNPGNGECESTPLEDGTACDFGGLPGRCVGGACEDAMLCMAVDCSTGNPCIEGTCDPLDGLCDESALPDDTPCGDGGSCDSGVCVLPVDPDPQTVPQDVNCSALTLTFGLPLNLTVDPDAELKEGGSATVRSIVEFTIAEEIGNLLIGFGTDTVTVSSSTLEVSVNGGTPTLLTLTGPDTAFQVDVDPDDDGEADAVTTGTEEDITVVTNDGSPSVEFEITDFEVMLTDVPILQQLTLSNDGTVCTLQPPATPITF